MSLDLISISVDVCSAFNCIEKTRSKLDDLPRSKLDDLPRSKLDVLPRSKLDVLPRSKIDQGAS